MHEAVEGVYARGLGFSLCTRLWSVVMHGAVEGVYACGLCGSDWMGLGLGGEHGVPGGEEGGGLAGDLQDVGGDVFLVDYQAEHVFVKPSVGHDQMAVVGAAAPAVLYHPFLRCTAFVKVYRHKCHGM